jgi:uncharacterized protein (TIGR03435 family)
MSQGGRGVSLFLCARRAAFLAGSRRPHWTQTLKQPVEIVAANRRIIGSMRCAVLIRRAQRSPQCGAGCQLAATWGRPLGPACRRRGRSLSQSGRAERHCSVRNWERFVPFAGGFVSEIVQEIVKPIVEHRTGESENDANHRRCFGVMIITSLGARGQSAPATLAFEAASVKPAALSTDGDVKRSFNGDAGRIDYKNVTLKGLIMRAYGVKEYQITGPDWLDSNGYDIVATIPHDATEAQLPQMLQTLLAERFKLTLRHKTKDLPVYALVAGKNGPKLQPVEQEESFSMRIGPKGRHIEGKSRLAGLCEFLSRTMDRPVVDMTGLKGVYDITLDWAPDDSEQAGMVQLEMRVTSAPGVGGPPAGVGKGSGNMPDNTGGATIFTALQERLGLKLEQRKSPADFLIVDRVERMPVEN